MESEGGEREGSERRKGTFSSYASQWEMSMGGAVRTWLEGEDGGWQGRRPVHHQRPRRLQWPPSVRDEPVPAAMMLSMIITSS